MNTWKFRAKRDTALPSEEMPDSRLQPLLQQAFSADDVSPALRQRITDMAAYHEQQVVLYLPKRARLRFAFTIGSAASLICLAYLITFHLFLGIYVIPSQAMEPTLMGHDAGNFTPGAMYKNSLHEVSLHDRILINKWVYWLNAPRFGDIVVFTAPKEADAEHKYRGTQVENVLVKRLIGLPGDTIKIIDGRVYRNGKPLNEPYIKEPMDPNLEPNFTFGPTLHSGSAHLGPVIHLAPNQLWVMGDNRNNSNDSRYWGALAQSRIIGKVSWVIAPWFRWRSIP